MFNKYIFVSIYYILMVNQVSHSQDIKIVMRSKIMFSGHFIFQEENENTIKEYDYFFSPQKIDRNFFSLGIIPSMQEVKQAPNVSKKVYIYTKVEYYAERTKGDGFFSSTDFNLFMNKQIKTEKVKEFFKKFSSCFFSVSNKEKMTILDSLVEETKTRNNDIKK